MIPYPTAAVTKKETSFEDLDRLQTAALLCTFDRDLRKSAYSSIAWGTLSLAVGLFFLFEGSRAHWVSLVLGGALCLEGFYELRVRDPHVIKVAAYTLGALALWNLGLFAAGIYLGLKLGGHPIVGVMQAVGAWNTYKSFGYYEYLFHGADRETVEQVKQTLKQLMETDPQAMPDVVIFDAKASWGNVEHWRVLFINDLALFAQQGRLFRKTKNVEVALWVYRKDIELEVKGEKWMSSKQKASVKVNDWKLEKAEFQPDMLQRMEGLRG